MASFDDRPVSIYDNLNLPTAQSTPTRGSHIKFEIPSKIAEFNGNEVYAHVNKKKLVGNGNQSSMIDKHRKENPLVAPTTKVEQVKPTLNNYSTVAADNNLLTSSQIIKTPTVITTATTTTTLITPLPLTTINAPTMQCKNNAPTTPTTTMAIVDCSTSLISEKATARPLSQHSQSEAYEASQSIAAVKAAIHDAKSKFFGLNGFSQQQQQQTPQQLQYLPQLPIIANSSSKPQPKYQNIPENSAIYRQQHNVTFEEHILPPPQLPPKPNQSSGGSVGPTKASSPSPSAISHLSNTSSVNSGNWQSPAAAAAAAAKMTSVTSPTNSNTYTQIPLNDIMDSAQPSQAVYMSTTVPQNIKGSKIAGRHTPTRNSLRHSRMLVVNNRNFEGVEYPNPMYFKTPNLARWLLILQIILGVMISFLAIWILCLAPNTLIQDNPYWSGLALFFAGSLGLSLVRFQRIKRHRFREKFFLFLRADSYILSCTALLLCIIAIICAGLHYTRLTASDTRCKATDKLVEHSSCACIFNAIEPSNATDSQTNGFLDQEASDYDEWKVVYRDMSCQEVAGEWMSVLVTSLTLNGLGCIVSLAYMALLVFYRHHSKRFYSSVQTSTF